MKPRLLPKVASLIIIGICTALAGCCILTDTLQTSRVKPVHLQDLLVDRSAFPEGWGITVWPQPHDPKNDRYSVENLYVSLGSSTPHTGASQEIYRYKNELQAQLNFHLAEAADFYSSTERRSDWRAPSGWTYLSPSASDFQFACADFSYFEPMTTSCVARARYDEFVSIFNIAQLSGSVDLQDLERILRDIDARMEKNLK